MNGKILVTTDGSPHSRRVLPHAALLARATQADIVLARVIEHEDSPQAGQSREQAIERLTVDTSNELTATLNQASLEGQPLVSMRKRDEGVAAAILRLAEEQGAMMLAMDTRGEGALRHALMGSVAMDILARSSIPVLLSGDSTEMPAEADESYTVVIMSDGSHAAGEIVRQLAPVLQAGSCHVTLMRVYQPKPGENETRAMAEAEEQLSLLRSVLPESLDVETFVRKTVPGGGVDTAVIERARELGARAIALSSHGSGAARHLLMGNTASTLLGRSHLPVIVARAPE